jgi:5'-nucleotidase
MKEVFEHSVGIGIPDGRFLQVSGITVTYNISNPTGSRVVALSLADGTPIVEDGEVVAGGPVVNFVTNSFTAAGGDDYAMLAPLDKIAIVDESDVPISYERALLLYLDEDDASFPENVQGLPTVQDGDERYVPGGEGRIQFVSGPVSGIAYLMMVIRP